MEPDEAGVLSARKIVAELALARCPSCGKRVRVLPYDVLPRKTYSLAVVEHLVAAYARGRRSLRDVAWDVPGERTPSHTTLFGWSEGLGAYALGRAAGEVDGAPYSRLLADAEARRTGLEAVAEHELWVDERRYRSEVRRERLAAVAKLLLVAALVTGLSAPRSLAEFRRLGLVWSNSCGLVFRSRLSCTATEHRDRLQRRGSACAPRAGRDRCRIPTRSPPGASSRSLR